MKWGGVAGGVALAALGSLCASLTDSLPARAADMSPVSPRAVPGPGYIPAQFLWTGFYMGAGFGDGWGTATFTDPLAPAVTGSPSINGGFLYSGVLGINYQFSSVVVGVEGDITGSFANGSAIDAAGNTLQTRVFWTASFTGRLGWAIDRLLIYGKGGVAFDNDRDIAAAPLPSTTSVTGTMNHFGWTVGGGAEYAITEHWTARIEYDYFAFSSKALSLSGPGAAVAVSGAVGINFNEIKGIVAYKF